MRPKGSAEALEVRRRIAANLLQQGKGLLEVARLVGASPSSVFRWHQALQQSGPEALQARPHPGRPPRLTPQQKQALTDILLQGAPAAGFPTDLWTLTRVAQVITRMFGVAYHPGHVWRILREMDWRPQKPERRARAVGRETHYQRETTNGSQAKGYPTIEIQSRRV